MNPCFVTQPNIRLRKIDEAIVSDWAAGREFRMYRAARMITTEQSAQLLAAGFTHIAVIWQREDLSATSTLIDIAHHMRK